MGSGRGAGPTDNATTAPAPWERDRATPNASRLAPTGFPSRCSMTTRTIVTGTPSPPPGGSGRASGRLLGGLVFDHLRPGPRGGKSEPVEDRPGGRRPSEGLQGLGPRDALDRRFAGLEDVREFRGPRVVPRLLERDERGEGGGHRLDAAFDIAFEREMRPGRIPSQVRHRAVVGDTEELGERRGEDARLVVAGLLARRSRARGGRFGARRRGPGRRGERPRGSRRELDPGRAVATQGDRGAKHLLGPGPGPKETARTLEPGTDSLSSRACSTADSS